jgi:peptide/nickel transport system permease protein
VISRGSLADLLLRRLGGAVPLLLGVSLIGFLLTQHIGPDPVWELAGRSPTEAELAALSEQLDRDRGGLERYLDFMGSLLRLDPGASLITGESVRSIVARTVPVTLALMLPGLILGFALSLALGYLAARHRDRWLDRSIAGVSALSMSISLVIVVMLMQLIFSVWLGWFPARGWSTESFQDWLVHVTVPTLIVVLVNLGYNVRFFRALWLEALQLPSVRAARAYGLSEARILFRRLLPWTFGPIMTRLLFAVPMLLLGGSLVIETHFGIPGVGRVFYNALLSGDQPVILALVVLTGSLVVACQVLVEVGVRWLDPRARLR